MATNLDPVRDPIAKSLRARLGGQLGDADYDALATAVADEHKRLVCAEKGLIDPSLTEPRLAYAIHDDDLKLLDACTGAAAVGLAVTFNPAALLLKIIPFMYTYYRKRYPLTRDQALVLRSLKRAPRGGFTVAEIHTDIRHEAGVQVSLGQIAQELDSLTDVLKGDNTSTAFTKKHGDRWVAVDV